MSAVLSSSTIIINSLREYLILLSIEIYQDY